MSCALIWLNAIALLVGAARLDAQTTLDFSGDWVMTSLDAGVDVPRELRVRVTTESGGQVLKVDRRGLTGTRTSEYRIGVVSGSVIGDQETRFSVRWIGSQLVIQQGSYAGALGDKAPFTETEETWSFDANGHLKITSTTRERDAAARTTQALYRRR